MFGKPTFRDVDGARDFFKTFDDKRPVDMAASNQILDKEMEEIRKLDLGELKDAKAELLGQ